MKTKWRVLRIAALCLYLAVAISGTTSKVHAAIPYDCPDGTTVGIPPPVTEQKIKSACDNRQSTPSSSTNGLTPFVNDCKLTDEQRARGEVLNKDNCRIIGMLLVVTNILSGLVAVVIVGMITFGGIRYTTAGGDPQKVVAARGQIRNALIALVLYIFMFAFLQWIVPGGLF